MVSLAFEVRVDLFLIFGGYQSFFWVGPLILLFWTSDLGFRSLTCFLPACNGFLRFTSGVAPAASMAVEPF